MKLANSGSDVADSDCCSTAFAGKRSKERGPKMRLEIFDPSIGEIEMWLVQIQDLFHFSDIY